MALHNLPLQTIPFIGRNAEVGEIERLLTVPACRLLSLVGTGGIGKTRLALEIAQRSISPDDVYYVSLQSLISPDFIVSTLAEVVNLYISPDAEPKQQLLNFFRDNSCFLVIDNLEHLLEDVILLSEILAVAPGVHILTTSRERLNLREEWVFEVSGLNYPASETEDDIQSYGALELFTHHARRANVNFHMTDENKPAIIRICHLVGGMPLAIELAASWIRVLSCEQITSEIEHSLDILETTARNVEPRHRTMRAAFEPTWNRLSKEERRLFTGVSVFRGGFTRAAAEYVANVSLWTLTALVDKSILRVGGNGRYDMHELLRQYAAEKLSENSLDNTDIQDRHAAYYAERWLEDGIDLENRAALVEMRKEIDNLRVAYRRTINEQRWNQLNTFLEVLGPFFEAQGWHHEGAEAFRLATEALRTVQSEHDDNQQRILGRALAWEGWFIQFILRYDEARQIALESVSLLLPLGDSDGLYYAYKVLSYIASDRSEAHQYSLDALKHAQQIDHYGGIVSMNTRLSQLHFVAGEYDEALHTAQVALSWCRSYQNHYAELWVLRRLSDIALAQANYAEAKKWALEGIKIAEDINAKHGLSLHYLTLGSVAYAQGNFEEAIENYRHSLSFGQALNHKQFIVWAEGGLGRVLGRMGRGHEARTHFLYLLRLVRDTPNVDIQLDLLAGIADLMTAEGQPQRAVELLAPRLQNPDNIGRYHVLDNAVRKQLEGVLVPDVFAAAWEDGVRKKLDAVMMELAVEFSQIVETDNSVALALPRTKLFTEREIEVLRLIADGLSNREIAEQLGLATSTVKWYINEIFSKLHVTNRIQAVTRAKSMEILS